MIFVVECTEEEYNLVQKYKDKGLDITDDELSVIGDITMNGVAFDE